MRTISIIILLSFLLTNTAYTSQGIPANKHALRPKLMNSETKGTNRIEESYVLMKVRDLLYNGDYIYNKKKVIDGLEKLLFGDYDKDAPKVREILRIVRMEGIDLTLRKALLRQAFGNPDLDLNLSPETIFAINLR